MRSRSTCLVLLIVLLALVQGSAFGAFNPLKDPAIIGWWTCDEGEGEVVADSSPNGHDGRFINGSPAWRTGMYGNAITLNGPTLVEIPAMGLTLSQATMAGWLFAPAAQPEWASFIMHRSPGPASGFNMLADRQLAYHWNDAADTWSYRPGVYHPLNEWAHCAVTVEPTKATFYLNGVSSAVNNVNHAACAWDGPIWLGGDGGASWVARRMAGGSLDDVCFFSRALTGAEIVEIMGGLTDPALAGVPSPADEATDIHQDAGLAWMAGETATAHDVYLGTSFDDVNNATRAIPGTVLVSQGQADAAFEPGLLELGKTYYWRVDEVDAGGTVLRGNVWSFTVEPFAYPIANITATASSAQPGMGPQNTVSGLGLNANDQHSVELTNMWMSTGVQPNWIQFEFDKVYKLDELWVWNSNQMIEPFIGFGAKDVTLEYSTDGATWTALEGVPEFAQATGTPSYTANTTVDLGGIMAKYVKLTITQNWGGVAPQTGLAEVRFFQVPVQAREPQPADDATEVSIDATLDWRPGREATSHEVYFGTDANALSQVDTVTDHSYTPAGMEFGTQYFWKVNEVGDAGAYEGDVWSFLSQEFTAIDDMESYNDDDNRIYDSWIDGWVNGTGSQVGNDVSPFAEKSIVHSGKQSMPLRFDNTKAPFYSEAEREFATAVNCTGNGATELCVWTRGYPALGAGNFVEAAGKISVTGAGADIWNNSDEFTYVYKTLEGDGSMVARVTSSGTGTNTWAKGGVMIRDSLNGGSAHAMMVITTPGVNGASFQYRAAANGASAGTDSAVAVAVPYWVKIDRAGDNLTGYHSANGTTWSMVSSAVVPMAAPVQIGLCVTSHAAGEDRTFQFESVTTTGSVTGAWKGVVIASPLHNDPADMYLTVTDSAGKSATAISSTAATAADWTRWVIPGGDLAGVNLSKVKKMVLGVGNKAAPAADGAGIVFIDDIGYGRSAQ